MNNEMDKKYCSNCGESTHLCTCGILDDGSLHKKCKQCGEFIQKGQLCLECSKNSLEAHIKRQIYDGQKTITILIGDLLAKETAELISHALDEHSFISQIDLKARGRHMTKAIDVSEILKRELKLKPKIKTDTSEFRNKEDQLINVSEICISLKRGGK